MAKFIIPLLQKLIDSNKIEFYIEPFVGGANVIDKIRCKNRFGYDIHEGLIFIYKAIQNGWKPPLFITEEDYIKAKNNKYEEPLKSYIGFNASYASKYFGGFARGYKKDKKTVRNIYNERTKNFIKQIPFLQNIIFEKKEYENIDTSQENSLIYNDPPYFFTYNYKNKKFNHIEFWNWCRKMSEKNIVVISEFNAPDDFISIWQKERNISLDKNTGGKKNIEKLFIHRTLINYI